MHKLKIVTRWSNFRIIGICERILNMRVSEWKMLSEDTPT